MRYGLVRSDKVDEYPDDGKWVVVACTLNTRNWQSTKWIHLDDAIEYFSIPTPIIKRFSDWVVAGSGNQLGVYHLGSSAKFIHTRLHEGEAYKAHRVCVIAGLGYTEADMDKAIQFARKYSESKPVMNAPKPQTVKRVVRLAQPHQQNTISGVYLLRCGEHYKIGMSDNVSKRVKQIQTNSPHEVKHIHTIPTDNPSDLEQQLHTRFASKRVRGEWFALSDDDVSFICSLNSPH